MSSHLCPEEIRCPWCKTSNIHISTASILTGEKDDNYAEKEICVVHEGNEIQTVGKIKTFNRMREPSIELFLKCEACPEEFYASLYFHKGQVFFLVSTHGLKGDID